ncbi:2',3'-cyclic-nucleotide 2'-phosphodiesterase [Tateyamaria omphalii]|uniref:5'-nucleotidase C-terminal domain-containing protein n=1 Tax=Tateyamaria omphalii TaxID=299262 RepID=UPI001678BD0B|nr:5'-nucleotidase C-terminal domain-containing protein [Tateyamaria omphalii]GGX43706.1 2',3'-cyclic-nucleotide 2'-phosphodiesterase [Tateyamaria omphalii]
MTLPTACLRIAATSDVHMQLTGWDALHDKHMPSKGMDRLANLVFDARGSAKGGFIMLDNGDALQGTSLGDICVDSPDEHPWPAVLHALDYDAVGLGNHDFDFGLSFLNTVMGQASCPVLCASETTNAITCTTSFTIIKRSLPCSDGQDRLLRVGLTSVLPPQTAIWNRRCLDDKVHFEGGVEAAGKAVSALRDAGADLVVLLCHSGLDDDIDAAEENFGAAIAAKVSGIDAMILGHTHLRFPGPDHTGFQGVDAINGTVWGVPAVMPGPAGTELGLIDLTLLHGENGWQVNEHNVRRSAVRSGDAPNQNLFDIISPVIDTARTHLSKPIGTTPEHLNTWFSMLRPSAAEALIASALSGTIANAIAGTGLDGLPILASVAPVALGGRTGPDNYVDIPAGPLCERHVAMLCPYPNTVWAAVLTGADLYNWIERSLAFFNPPYGDGAALVNPDAPAFNFDMLHGMEVEVNLETPAAFGVDGHRIRPDNSRIRQLTYLGRPVSAQARFVVAMTSYRGAGGGNYPGIGPQTEIVRTQVEMRDALRAAVTHDLPSTIVPGVQPWRFKPNQSARRVIQTSPVAAGHLSYISEFDPQLLGLDESGFLQIEVTI